MFDSIVLHRVSLRLANADGATLDVYLDDQAAILVVEDGSYRPTEATASRREVLRAAGRYLHQVGVDSASGTLNVALGQVGEHWYLTFDRTIEGYPVANAPAAWWLVGDKAFLALRPDASLLDLYVIRPEHLPVPKILDRSELDARLAEVAKVTPAKLRSFDRAILWVRAGDPLNEAANSRLSLNYCATTRSEDSWQAWCVDAGTGEFSAQGNGID